jgi:hypothetical protein
LQDEAKEIAIQKAEEGTSAMGRVYENMLDNIQDNTADTFRTMMDDGLDKWSTFADGIKDIMKDTLAQIAAIFVQKPLEIPVVAK